ncbi:MAG: HEAT repeat domain-containing protein [Planctomycetota bacterium]|jgi:HEAT repeat protein
MSATRLYLLILLLVIGCQQAGVSANKPALRTNEAVAEAELDKQLKINRDALLKGTSEQTRIDAAAVMLFSENPLARKILLDVLKQTENRGARAAVCKALSQTRAAKEPVKNKNDFIQPLLEILTMEEDFDQAKLAAEATLIFEYWQIQEQLEKIVTDSSLSAKARLNAIYALKLQPAKEAILKLMDLLDDSDKQIAGAAEKALISLNIPIGEDAGSRKQIRDEFNRMGRDEFLRVWKIRQQQEERLRELVIQLNLWKGKYLFALGKIYSDFGDDAAKKGKFLAEHLGDLEVEVRLWALEKVYQWRIGTTLRAKLPVELGPILVGLISDEEKSVRLKTAKLLSLMEELNSAEKLLEQLKTEEDDEVKTELFVALGRACYYAFLPTSGIKVPKEIRKQTLDWAVKYLLEEEPKKAQKGAEVITKLLEQDGLAPEEISNYLGLLVERYNQQKKRPGGTLRGELLSAMADLCAQSVCQAESSKLFKPLFEEALTDETNLVREAAVNGLVYIDKAKALKILRDFIKDNSEIVRKKVIELAGEVGNQDDLFWLWEKIGLAAESEPAWQAMLKIFKRSEAAVLAKWVGKFVSPIPNVKGKLSDEQKVSFLEMAERKATSENKVEMLRNIRSKLADLYKKSGDFEKAAKYFGVILQDARTAEHKELILADLMDAYLRWPNIQSAKELVANCLLEKDLDRNSAVVGMIDNYLSNPPAGVDPEAVLKALIQIKPPPQRPKWLEQVKLWAGRLGRAKESDKPKEGSN